VTRGRRGRDRSGDRRRPGGFTLIELLVVLFVVAVMAGLAVVRLGDRDSDLELRREAQRLQQILELVREEALIGGAEWGLELTREGYGLLRLDPVTGLWSPVEERGTLAAWTLPEGIELRLNVEDRSLAPEALGTLRGDHRPALLMLSSGEMTPFSLRVVAEGDIGEADLVYVLSSDGYGAVQLERGQDDREPASTIFSALPVETSATELAT
jgi:general secretion pathway protein H